MIKIIINAFGPDKPGLVYKITNVIKKNNGNIEISKMLQLESDFSLLLLIQIPSKNKTELFTELDSIEDLKTNYKITKTYRSENNFHKYLFTIKVADNEGIIYLFSNLFKKHSINIINMESSVKNAANTGYPLFILESTLAIPMAINMEKLKSELIEISEKNNIVFDLRLE